MLRCIRPIPLTGIRVQTIASELPRFGWADPRTLLVEDDYQRRLTQRSITLIRKIASEFDWLHVKPPVCARGAGGKLCVVDGQHTAIAAASRGITKIPVMIVEAPEVVHRARAFVAHNTNRLNITPLHLVASRLAAGDKAARAAEKAAKAAGVTLSRVQPANGMWRVGETVSVAGVQRLVARLGEERAARVLKTLVAAKRAPVVVHEILAVAAVLFDPKLGWDRSTFDRVTVIRSTSVDAWRRQVLARSGSAADGFAKVALWKGVAQAWVRAGGPRRMIDWEARVKVLEAENETLRERVRSLEDVLLGRAEPPPFFHLTASEATLFNVLMSNRAPRVETFMTALYSTNVDDPPDEKIIDVLICKVRKKLKPYGIEIKTNWGDSWEMPDGSKAEPPVYIAFVTGEAGKCSVPRIASP